MLNAEQRAWVDAYEAYREHPITIHEDEDDDMAIRTTNNSGDFQLVPAGMTIGRCYRVIDLGTHQDKTFGKPRHLGWLFWELPNRQREDGECHIIGKRYTLSHNEKANLRQDLESWYGRKFDDKALDDAGGFDLERLLGREALLNIVHSDDGKFANIASVNPLPQGMECPAPIHEKLSFGFDPYDPRVFEQLSEKMQEFIKGSQEWQATVNGHQPEVAAAPAPAKASEDVPFGPAKPQPTRSQLPPPTGGKFDDMEDDIPF